MPDHYKTLELVRGVLLRGVLDRIEVYVAPDGERAGERHLALTVVVSDREVELDDLMIGGSVVIVKPEAIGLQREERGESNVD
jgi:hypothetical protein